ncbi:MAG TPA: RagB/SusD family nutrient uptake outer membrane protein, partial [Chitinophagaceae bacterium]|nr:RagB/SusD family nutrient uptake outer membrane protein [Chitinophagaceae bacterium]
MKNKISYLAICILSLLAACEKLDREIDTDLDKTQIETIYGNLGSLLNGVYAELPEGFQPVGGAMLASTTDEAEHAIETSSIQNFNNGNWSASNNPDNAWLSHFRAIRKANVFLQSSDRVNHDQIKLDPSPSQQSLYLTRVADVTRWKYEARFLRAFFYFELVKRYGGVPIMRTPLTEADIAAAKRNTLQECVQFISDECDSAAANLPANYSNDLLGANTNAGNLGRATKGAALALKSRLLLYAASDLFNTPAWAAGYPEPLLISLPAGDRALRWKAAADAAKAVIDLPGTGYAMFNNYST